MSFPSALHNGDQVHDYDFQTLIHPIPTHQSAQSLLQHQTTFPVCAVSESVFCLLITQLLDNHTVNSQLPALQQQQNSSAWKTHFENTECVCGGGGVISLEHPEIGAAVISAAPSDSQARRGGWLPA